MRKAIPSVSKQGYPAINLMKKTLIFLSVFFFLISSVSATYITGDIHINELGEAIFKVETDVPLNIPELNFKDGKLTGETSVLTSKEKELWTFSLNENSYDSIFLNIHLPSNLNSISTIEGNKNIIDIDSKTITIIDENELNFSTSYTLNERKNYAWLVWLIIFLIASLIYFAIKKIRSKKQKLKQAFPYINENEQKILEALMNSPIRQKELRKKLNIPKASFTRYILNLEKKKLIQREGEGKNKILKIK